MPKHAKKREYDVDEDSDQEQAVKPSKKVKGSSSTHSTTGTKTKDSDGNPYWEVRGSAVSTCAPHIVSLLRSVLLQAFCETPCYRLQVQ